MRVFIYITTFLKSGYNSEAIISNEFVPTKNLKMSVSVIKF